MRIATPENVESGDHQGQSVLESRQHSGSACVLREQAISEIENALGFACDKLGSEAVETVMVLNDDARVSEQDNVLGGGVEGLAHALG